VELPVLKNHVNSYFDCFTVFVFLYCACGNFSNSTHGSSTLIEMCHLFQVFSKEKNVLV
jgi:hypothetical protein